MALTKITRAILDTGISDSSDATAITISSSEQVMIGTTDAGYPDYGDSLTVADVDGGGGNAGMTIRSGTSSYGTFYFSDATGTAAGAYAGKMQYNHSTNSMVFGTNSSDRLTIDSSGNIGLGTTSPAAELHINDTGGLSRIRLTGTAANADDFEFGQGTTGVANGGFEIYDVNESTTRFLIDSNGKILIGKTASSISANAGFELTDGGLNMYSTQTSGSVSSTYHVLYGSSTKFYVDYAGVVYASNTSITSLSDERLKENVKDLDTGLSDILELKPKRFDWKEGEGTGEKNVSGFIAQDVEDTNFSDLVGNFKHNSLDDCKSFQYSGLIPALVKSIQELSAKVEELESKINE